TTNNGFEDYRVVDVSANGRFVLFEKKEAFALTNTEAGDEFIVVDTLTGNTRSVLAQASFALGTHALDISEDGRYVIYQEFQSGNSEHGIYEYDLQTGSRTKITAEGQLFSGNAFQSPSSVDDILSANGRYLAYDVVSSGQTQVFVQDLNNPILQPRLVSAAADGTPGNDGSVVFGISGDGRFVAFGSDADNLVPN